MFRAIGDLGTTVSSLNDSTRNLTSHVAGATKKTAQTGIVTKVGKTAVNMNKKRKDKKDK